MDESSLDSESDLRLCLRLLGLRSADWWELRKLAYWSRSSSCGAAAVVAVDGGVRSTNS